MPLLPIRITAKSNANGPLAPCATWNVRQAASGKLAATSFTEIDESGGGRVAFLPRPSRPAPTTLGRWSTRGW